MAAALAIAALIILRDHRILRRYTYLAGAIGFGLLLLPLVPGLGIENYGSRIWISLGPFSFQPGEIAKIVLAVFFAGYLVQTRDALSVAGRRILGLTLPRARDLGPILVAWMLSVGVLVLEKDLGSSLLFFGLFVAMLYVATERTSWVAIGLLLFCVGCYVANLLFSHVQRRVLLWLDTFSREALDTSDRLARGLMGMASGGMVGTGLGRGRPDLTYFAESDFIIPSLRRGDRPHRALRAAHPLRAPRRAWSAHRHRRPRRLRQACSPRVWPSRSPCSASSSSAVSRGSSRSPD